MYFGRLDGRAFRLTAPAAVFTGQPAKNGSVIAGWRDQSANKSVVVLADTDTGEAKILYKTSARVSSPTLSADGSAWYWIEASGSGASAKRALRRQALPGGTIKSLVQVAEDGLILSADATRVLLIPAPEPTSDCPPATDSRVWSVDSGSFVSVASAGDLPFGVIGDSVLIEGWCSQLGIRAYDTSTASSNSIDADGYGAGVYLRAGGEPVIVYSRSLTGQLFRYSVGGAEPQPLPAIANGPHQTIPEATPGLVRNLEFGGVRSDGWVPFFSGAAAYWPKPGYAFAQTRLLINIETGAALVAPQIGEPVNVQLQP